MSRIINTIYTLTYNIDIAIGTNTCKKFVIKRRFFGGTISSFQASQDHTRSTKVPISQSKKNIPRPYYGVRESYIFINVMFNYCYWKCKM